MESGGASKRIALIVEGFKQDRAKYICGVLQAFFRHLGMLVHSVSFEGLALSLLNPQYKGVAPSEMECRDAFLHLTAMAGQTGEQFIVVCDTLTEPYERREAYFSKEYSVETNAVFILAGRELPEVRAALGLKPEGDPWVAEITSKFAKISQAEFEGAVEPVTLSAPLKEAGSRGQKKYLEKICMVLSDVKKNLILCRKVKIFQGIYLHSKYSTLYLLHTGYTVFYTVQSPVLQLVAKLASKLSQKKKWSVYLCAHHRPETEGKKEVARLLRSEGRFRKELKTFCEKEKIGCGMYASEASKSVLSGVAGIAKIEAPVLALGSADTSRDLLESLLLVEGLDKTLVVSSPAAIKVLLAYLKRTGTEEVRKQLAPAHTVIKISVKHTEVEEKRYFLAHPE